MSRVINDRMMEATLDALKRGERYGDLYLREAERRGDGTPTGIHENAYHMVDRHVNTRLARALEAIEYDDYAEFYKQVGAAIGFLSTLCDQTEHLLRQG